VAVVVHTTTSDWSKLQVAGIRTTLESYGATILEVIDCGFRAEQQIASLDALVERRPDAIISIPLNTTLTAEAHRRVADAGIKLVLMDNAPVGMLARKHYVSVISADNFGNGQTAAELLSDYVPLHGVIGVIGFGVDYFVTNEREIAFCKWMKERRADAVLRRAEFRDANAAGEVALEFVRANRDVAALFVVWDEPAMYVARALRSIGLHLPITTVDLGREVALELASGGLIKGLGAQLPYDQGVAEATAAIMALLGDEPPPWVALPGLSVTRQNVLEAYEAVWHIPPPQPLQMAAGAAG
jgi:ribose transport system substrate-binding protein